MKKTAKQTLWKCFNKVKCSIMNFAFSVTKDTNNLKLLPPKSNKFLVFKMLYNGDFTEVFKLNLIPCYGNLLNKILRKLLGRIIFSFILHNSSLHKNIKSLIKCSDN